MNLKSVSAHQLVSDLKSLVKKENEILHLIIEYVREVDVRRLYLERGFPSLFEFMTKEMGYTAGSAQRRIDAARLSRDIPDLGKKIEQGKVNLHQISEIQRAARQAAKTTDRKISKNEKADLIEKLENLNLKQSQILISQQFNLPLIEMEKQRHQMDSSVRLELTLSEEQMKKLERCKELLSHCDPTANFADVIERISDEFLKKKEVSLPKTNTLQKTDASPPREEENDTNAHCQMEVAVPVSTRRLVFQRDQCCQYRSPTTGKKCESRYFLQVDHKIPRWAGGGNGLKNLQLLCAAHNQEKYRREVGIKFG